MIDSSQKNFIQYNNNFNKKNQIKNVFPTLSSSSSTYCSLIKCIINDQGQIFIIKEGFFGKVSQKDSTQHRRLLLAINSIVLLKGNIFHGKV